MKSFKKTLALFLATLMIVSAFAAYSVFATTNENEPAAASEPAAQDEGNTGTKTANWKAVDTDDDEVGDTFYITCLDDFKAFHDDAAANNYYAGKTVKLTKSLNMNDASWSWTRVGYFSGVFDGQNNTIENLTTTSGMFQYTSAGTEADRVEVEIKNVSFVGGGVITTSPAANTAFFISVPGSYNDIKFYNVHVDVSVTGTTSTAVFVSRLRLVSSVFTLPSERILTIESRSTALMPAF